MDAQLFTNSFSRDSRDDKSWKPLGLLNAYRFLLAGIFLLLGLTPFGPNFLGSSQVELYQLTCLAYIVISFASIFTIRSKLYPFHYQLALHIFTDIAAITLIAFASGGVKSGIALLLVVSIAGGSMLASKRISLFFASIAALFLLIAEFFNVTEGYVDTSYYTNAGIHGVIMFITALLANTLSKRIMESEALALQRGIDLANLVQLNEYIIQHMQTGIIVVDSNNAIRLMNESAWTMLSMPTHTIDYKLDDISRDLDGQLKSWREKKEGERQTFRSSTTSPEILPKFAKLGTTDTGGALIFLEDNSAVSQRAQQMKLASLGRLTASIAHEIRNPLGSISHASQLLNEDLQLNDADARLLEIIQTNSDRMNKIIENIMQLNRRDRTEPTLFNLKDWTSDFINDFKHIHGLSDSDILINIHPDDVEIRMDQSQLFQVIDNLCSNAWRHSKDYPGFPKIELHGGLADASTTPFLDIIDHGDGIPADTATQIFEPFYTTEQSGVGLGLYISRELCEANQARLDYIPVLTGGCCFRITFADPRRSQRQVV